MSSEKDAIQLKNISKKAVDIIDEFGQTTGLQNRERVVEQLAFSIWDLLKLIDKDIDPRFSSSEASTVLNTVKSALAPYRREKAQP